MQLFFGPTQLSLLQIGPIDSRQNSRHSPIPSENVLTSLTNDASFFRRQLVAHHVLEAHNLLFLMIQVLPMHTKSTLIVGLLLIRKC